MRSQAYDSLAEWFEYLNDDCDYPKWSQYFIEGLRERGAGKRGLEIGCGSGAFSRALTKNGYTMSAMDCSAPMLSKAARLAREEGAFVNFFLGDARTFRLASKVDFIIAPNDCYNYVKGEELAGAFAHAARALKKGGLFWLDVSSPCKLRGKFANTVFADDRDEVTYLSFNRLFEDRAEMNVTLFVRGEDGRFGRFDELHTLYIHEEETLLGALAAAGFRVLCVEGHLGEDKRGSDRLNLICERV